MLYQRPTLVNNLSKILLLPCHLTGAVYVEMAAEAILRFAVDVASPDPKEIYHHAVGEPLVHTIRSGLNDLGEAAGAEPTPVRRALGQLLGVEDQAIWWYFLMSASSDALLDATSTAIRMDPCLSGRGLGSGTGWIAGIHDDGSPNPASFQFPMGSKFYPVSFSKVRLSEANNWQGVVAASCTWVTEGNIKVGTQSTTTFIPDNGAPSILLDSFNNANPDGTATQPKNHTWARYQAQQGVDGELVSTWTYSGPNLPGHQALLDNSSTCFLSGDVG